MRGNDMTFFAVKTFNVFYSFLWRYRRRFIVSLVFALLASGFSSALPFFYRYLINHLPALTVGRLILLLGVFAFLRLGAIGCDHTKGMLQQRGHDVF